MQRGAHRRSHVAPRPSSDLPRAQALCGPLCLPCVRPRSLFSGDCCCRQWRLDHPPGPACVPGSDPCRLTTCPPLTRRVSSGPGSLVMGLFGQGLSLFILYVIFIIFNLNLMTCKVVFPHLEEQDPGAAFLPGVEWGGGAIRWCCHSHQDPSVQPSLGLVGWELVPLNHQDSSTSRN